MSGSNDGVFKEINETANACTKVFSETIRRIFVPWEYINEELERHKEKPKTKNNRDHFYDMYGSPRKSSSTCDTDTYVENLDKDIEKDTDFDVHSFETSATHHSPYSDLSNYKSTSHNVTTKSRQATMSIKSKHSGSKCSRRRKTDSYSLEFSDVDTWVHDVVKECQK